MKTDLIVLGGGIGSRFKGDCPEHLPKQFTLVEGRPVWIHSVARLTHFLDFRSIVVTFPSEFLRTAEEQVQSYLPKIRNQIFCVPGGETRQQSAFKALGFLEEVYGKEVPDRVLIHDACRPVIREEFARRVSEYLNNRAYAAWIPVIEVTDTLKTKDASGSLKTLDRSKICRAQTPQIFEFSLIRTFSQQWQAGQNQSDFTDDAALLEHYGIPVGSFLGDIQNIKMTYEFEVSLIRTLLSRSQIKSNEELACVSESAMTFTDSSLPLQNLRS